MNTRNAIRINAHDSTAIELTNYLIASLPFYTIQDENSDYFLTHKYHAGAGFILEGADVVTMENKIEVRSQNIGYENMLKVIEAIENLNK